MDTFLEMQTALQEDLTVTTASTLFPLTVQKRALNRSYIKSAGLYRWPMLNDARKTSSVVNGEYYDFPTDWRPNSMWRLEIDGEVYGETPDGSPMRYEDFLDWLADPANANSTEKKWAVQWKRFFVYPTTTSVGNNNISIWGQENVEALSADSDTTIFSYDLPECNEAIVLEAKAMLKKKSENVNTGQMFSGEALALLTTAFNKIRQENSKMEKTRSSFQVPDFFRGNNHGTRNSNIGQFNTDY